jgi:hypothetical protein
MAETIQQLYCDPPIAVARLGGSTTAMGAYVWVKPPSPRADGETVAVPDWSLDILSDGSVQPSKAETLAFRDGNLIRPVCPFVEIHVRLGEPGSDPATWRDAPLTPALLAQFGADAGALRFVVTARNQKAARRRQNADLVFGTFPPVEIAGDQHTPVPLNGTSPPGVARPMVPDGRHIPLGAVQVMLSRPQPAPGSVPWPTTIDLSVIRFRFTPARGRFYGPPEAAQPTAASPVAAVAADNAFLDPEAGWFGETGEGGGFVVPADTFDETAPGSGQSLGVVDDTCEARVDVALTLRGAPAATLTAHATIFVAPPDFAPDRRPFLSLADELNDRSADAAARSGALSADEMDDWVQDLFERVYETVSLTNVDFWRAARGIRTLTGTRLAANPIVNDGALPADQAMGSRDALRNRDLTVTPPSDNVRLPLSEHARERHRDIADGDRLRELVANDPARLRSLVRAPFEVEPGENGNNTTMRMPPFMRQSNALPLTLSAWQYELLMRWADGPPNAPLVAAADLSADAAARRDAVLALLS